MDTLENAKFLNLPEVPDVLPEEVAGFGRAARLGQRRVVAEGDVPLLIKALGVHRRGVDGQARRTLAQLAGHDLGGEPEPWLGWWRRHQAAGAALVSCQDPLCALAC